MKIGFIAMSGIRVRNEELLKLGLTLPGFVERSKVIASLPSLGLLTLAGMTPQEHEIEYHEIADLKLSIAADQVPSGFDLVAISSFSAQIDEAYNLANLFRREGTLVVMGGLHVTSVPSEAEQHCDAVIVGEGELNWLQVLRDAEQGTLKKRYTPMGHEFKLCDAPMPAFELLDISKYNRLTVQTTRGCPHKCDFCASSILLTKKYKIKPAEKVLAEIDMIKELWKEPFIEFADDNSFVNAAHWKKLLPEIKKRRIHWFTETDISVAYDSELLRLMREAGCAQVLVGLESPTPNALKGIDTKNWKLKQSSRYIKAVRHIQSYGISVNGCFVIGLDGHDETIFEKIPQFIEASGLHQVQVTLPTAFPGTPFYNRLKMEGRLIEETNWKKCTLFDLNFIPSQMSGKRLVEGFMHLATTLYDEENKQARESAFKKCMRDGIRSRRKNKQAHSKTKTQSDNKLTVARPRA